MEAGKRSILLTASNETQIRKWLADQGHAGFQVHEVSRDTGTVGLQKLSYNIDLKLGGIEEFRAVGYVALTFLAHKFPQVARQHGLAVFKDFILGEKDDNFVWWDFSTQFENTPKNEFQFGHRVVLGLSVARQEAYARVSLFSTWDFAMIFGPVDVSADQTVIIDIDPQAERPHDIKETRETKCLHQVNAPDSFTDNLSQTIATGEYQRLTLSLFEKIEDWHRALRAAQMLPGIIKCRTLGRRAMAEEVKKILDQQKSAIFNMMKFVIKGLKELFAADPTTASLLPLLDLLVAEDPTSQAGITLATACALELATIALVEQVCNDLESGKLDVKRLSLLLGGGPGAEIVGRATLAPMMAALGA